MTVNRRVVLSWLWSLGLAGGLIPFLCWPRPFTWKMLALGVMFIAILSRIVNAGEEGGMFDFTRSRIRGFAGLLVFAAAVIIAGLTYRLWIL